MSGSRSGVMGGILSSLAVLVIGAVLWGVMQGRLAGSAARMKAYEDAPLLTNYDGYFYLRMARDLELGRYAPKDPLRYQTRPSPPPLPSQLAVLASEVSGLPLRTAAFYLPAVLALCMLPVYLLWARALGSPGAALPAVLASCLSIFWFRRACVGWLDTDVLNLFFATSLPLAACGFTFGRGAVRVAGLGLYLSGLYLFELWWPGFGLAMGLASLGPYALSIFFPSGRGERWLKFLVLAAIGLCAAGIWLGWYSHLPGPLAEFFARLDTHLRLILGMSGQGVHELSGIRPEELAIRLGGSWPGFVLASAGLVLIAVLRPRQGLFLLPILAAGLPALLADRFAVFLVPLFALGLGFLLCRAANLLSAAFLPGRFATVICGLAAALVLIPNARACWNFNPPPVPRPEMAAFEAGARTLTPPNAVLWNWWDQGYPLQYFGERKTFADGGSASPEKIFLSCAPLAMSDPATARNWIRYFAAYGESGLGQVAAWAGGRQKAVEVLMEIFAHPERTRRILKERHARNPKWWERRLFPEVEAYVYLGRDVIMHLDSVIASGLHYFDSASDLEDHFRYGMLDKVRVSQDGIVDLEIPVALESMTMLAPGGLRRAGFGRDTGMHGFVSQSEGLFFLLDGQAAGTLLARLMLVTPQDVPGFRAVVYNPLGGGVWKVEQARPGLPVRKDRRVFHTMFANSDSDAARTAARRSSRILRTAPPCRSSCPCRFGTGTGVRPGGP